MAEEVGIVMTLYDRVSPTLKSIAGSRIASRCRHFEC